MDTERFKYSRTMNLPWSGSDSSDDVWWKDCKNFEGQEIVVTEKMDGECTTIYHDSYVHARSVDTSHHPSRTHVKKLAGEIGYQIPSGYRVCGENLYAYHSIFYTELPAHFLAFGIYDKNNICLSWSDVEELCQLLGIFTVPVIYKGIWDEKLIRDLWQGKGTYPTYETSVLNPKFPEDFVLCESEGYVVRLAAEFDYKDFSKSCAKYVRENHVKTSTHWMKQKVVPNLLKSS